MYPLQVEFKYTVKGQGIITCNRDWWEEVRGGGDGGWGGGGLGEKLLQESSTVLSEPKFGPPLSIKNSWIRR